MSFAPVAAGALVISACILNAVAAFLTLEDLDQRTANGKIGVVLLLIGEILLLGYDFAIYPLLTLSNVFKAGTIGALTILWILFLPLGLVLIGVGASMRRTGVYLKRRRR